MKHVTRRTALAAGLVSAVAAGVHLSGTNEENAVAQPKTQKMPVVYLPHGGGPWPFVDFGLDARDVEQLAGYLRGLGGLAQPKAVLVVSAHWETDVPTLMTSERPPMLYDYYGFPPASYEIQWPAPGDPKLAARVQSLLREAGFGTATDSARGFDHGTFIPLKLVYPEANVPTVQLSMLASLDPAEHLKLGRALAPLREEGVLIVGSGMSFHNMRLFRNPRAEEVSDTFDAWLTETVTLESGERDRRLTEWEAAPGARAAHPREEHLLPLMVAAGAAGADLGAIAFSDRFMGARITAVHFA
ncbi:MAG: dioxygenase [Myxococcales bacterium]|nr:dioxygenase [Myxococcales bacterium]MCB9575679.1 dioxygenase [Polyangiaceae bacterium]